MKNLKTGILFIGLFVCSSMAFAQSVNGVALKDITAEYVEIIGTAKMISHKMTIQLDFGQLNKVMEMKDTQVMDSEGKPLVLNSMVEALNFMSANGYEFVQAYAFRVNQPTGFHILLRKKK